MGQHKIALALYYERKVDARASSKKNITLACWAGTGRRVGHLASVVGASGKYSAAEMAGRRYDGHATGYPHTYAVRRRRNSGL
jgi:hypothetical protein